MSVNKYDSSTGTLTALASGDRTWIGTKAQYDAQRTAGTLPNNALIVITDDEVEMDTVPTEGSPVAVTSDGLYNILQNSSFKGVNAKWIYTGSKKKITLRKVDYENLYLVFALKVQWKKQAIFTVHPAYEMATLVNVNSLTVSCTVNQDNSIQIDFGDTYMNALVVAQNEFTYTIDD